MDNLDQILQVQDETTSLVNMMKMIPHLNTRETKGTTQETGTQGLVAGGNLQLALTETEVMVVVIVDFPQKEE